MHFKIRPYFELVKDATVLVTIYPFTEWLEILIHAE